MRSRRQTSWFVALAVLLSGAAARADEKDRAADAQIFKPAMDQYGVFSVDSGKLAGQWQWGMKATVNLASQPISLNLVGSPAGGSTAPIDYNLSIDLQAYVGLLRWLELGMTATVMRQWLGSAFDLKDHNGFVANDPLQNMNHWPAKAMAGDLRLGLKFGLFDIKGFALAALITGIAPLGDETKFAGEKSFSGEGRIAFSYTNARVMAAANVGYILRRQEDILEPVAAASGQRNVMLEIDDELTWGIGAKVGIIKRLAIGAEVYGRVPVAAQGPKDLPMEALAGLIVRVTNSVSLAAGGGAGLGRYIAHNGIKPLGRASPWRFFLTVTIAPEAARVVTTVKDTDGDGIPDSTDACPTQPEDIDGFDDADGCPDPDNDQDGIQDQDDKCPNQTEDLDGYQDADGCPDVDNDGDGIPDIKDRCANQPEDLDGYQDSDGCPDKDNDGDGLADAADRCPDEPGPASNNGCPVATVGPTIVAGKIELKQKIYFDTGKATLLAMSKGLLDKVADLVKANPQVKLIRIEGHTDSRGNAKRNLVLSQRRAEAVRQYLIAKGVGPDRLQSVGYGDTRPIQPNTTRKGRAANRRVEFIIVRQ
ncbi:MAG: OmpA family protein [Deltaproteobacteria bacterium]|nr:OmpA family protein [Deltaproteobacteria bacterium]